MKNILAFAVFLSLVVSAKGQDKTLFSREVLIKGHDSLHYRMLLPENFDAARKYPVLLFLHGAGERGNDNEAQLTHGAKLFLDKKVRQDFPAIVIFPQCPKNDYWSNVKFKDPKTGSRFDFQAGGEPTRPMKLVMELMRDLKKRKFTDNDRIYVGGLSMGGMGTFEILRRKPKLFAAAIAICGGDNAANVRKYRKVPIWVFHGGKDDVVLPAESERVVSELKKLGSEVKYTLYPNANHNSWDPAFAEPELLPWLFSQKR